MSFISDYAKIVYFFREPKIEENELQKRFSSEQTKKIIFDFVNLSKNHKNFPDITQDDWNQMMSDITHSHNVTIGKLYSPLRYLLTGSEVGASIVDTLTLLSTPVSIKRISRYFDYFPVDNTK